MDNENRTIPRIHVECPMSYNNIDSPERKKGIALDVSNSGIQFLTTEKLEEGSLKEIRLEPLDNSIAPLNAIIQIVRVEIAVGMNNQFKTAGVIKIIK